MSAPIKRSIGLTKHRLQKYLTTVDALLQQQEHESPEHFISELKRFKLRISKAVDDLAAENNKWVDYICELDTEEQQEANKSYEVYTEGDDSFMVVMDQGKDMLHTIDETIEQESSRVNVLQTEHNLTDAELVYNDNIITNRVSLPKIQLPTFYGDPLQWNTFWQSYVPTIHNQPIPAIQKMTYLFSCLRGEALQEMQGFAITNENYTIVIDILHKRYGKSDKLIERLHTELIMLPTANESTQSLKVLSNTVDRICRQLNSLLEPDDSTFMMTTIKSKLPRNILTKLNEMHSSSSAPFNTTFLRDGLRKIIGWRAEAQSTFASTHQVINQFNKSDNNDVSHPKRSHHNVERTRNFAVATQLNRNVKTTPLKPSKVCFLCNNGIHWLSDCKKFVRREDRLQRLKELRKCFRCLQDGHMANQCSNNKVCYNCKGKHHQIICNKENANTSKSSHIKYSPTKSTIRSNVTTVNHQTVEDQTVVNTNVDTVPKETLLMTRKVKVTSSENSTKQHDALVFFDSGSQTSFITSELAQKMKLPKITEGEIEVFTFNNQKPMRFKSSKHVVQLLLNNGEKQSLVLCRTDNITTPLKTLKEAKTSRFKSIVKDIDANCESSKPDILIGIGDFWQFFKNVQKLGNNLHLIRTTIGPILCGKTEYVAKQNKHGVHSTISAATSFTFSENDDISNFWNLQNIGIYDDALEKDDDIAFNHFKSTIQQIDGRYRVKWPWREKNPDLPSNFQMSYYRLKTALRQLQKTPELLNKYNEVFQEQIQRDIIEIAPKQTEGLEHFLPHQPVIRLEKANTKLRVVFDASAHFKGKLSLNNCLYRGPVLLPDLAGLLLRFRLAPVVMLADIEKAFLMIELDQPDRNVTKFLWVKDVHKPPEGDNIITYRFQRVAFGVISSPFLLAATVQHHLQKYDEELAREIESNIYVDNVLMTATTVEEGLQKYKDSKRIFSDAKMNLREFVTNREELDYKIPEEDRLIKECPKVLGVLWKIKDDKIKLQIVPKLKEEKTTITRRVVLQEMASTFDPLGLIAPSILEAKIFFQSLWENGREWDTELTDDEQHFWKEFRERRAKQSIEIPRMIAVGRTQLHVFVDASQHAYAAAVYLRSTIGSETLARIIFSKNRLRPHQGMTIPRMELMAIVIGVRILKFVNHELRLPIEKEFLWSDSQCALNWISSTEDKSRFVTNRLREIRQHEHVDFNYVPTSENPADLSTRGMSLKELETDKQWWNGPPWLVQTESEWPKVLQVHPPEPPPEEQFNILLNIQPEEVSTVNVIDSSRFSSWKRMVNTIKRCMEFLTIKLKNHKNLPWNSTVINYETSELYLIKLVQRTFTFSDEKLNQWKVYKDVNGIFRVHTRMNHSGQHDDFINPILMDPKHIETKLLVLQAHQNSKHMGVHTTMTNFLSRFWMPNCRRTVKNIVKHCIMCKRYKAQPFKLPIMPNLPTERVNRFRAFENVGIDYLGPTIVRDEEQSKKIWIMLITCLSTRAIHLDVIVDLSANTFLNSLRRFIARRGKPTLILSDNGKCFVLGEKVIHDAWKQIEHSEKLREFADVQKIKWKFIPELSPWQGGVYERLVALVKNCFKRSIGKRVLSMDQMSTFISEVESVLNQRPLTYVDTEPEGILPLRPIDFIQPRIETFIPVSSDTDNIAQWTNNIENRNKVLQMWNSSLKILEEFWDRWNKEYLTQLRGRNQNQHKGPYLQNKSFPRLNEVVLIEQPMMPRNLWKLGKIVGLSSDEPAEIKNAKVRTSNGRIISRPICKLYPLEIEANRDSSIDESSVQVEDNDNIAPTIEGKTEHKYNLRRRQQRCTTIFTMPLTVVILTMLISVFGMPPTSKLACNECYARCTPHGAKIYLPNYIEKTEVCCNTEDCQEFEGNRVIELSLREELLINKYRCAIHLQTAEQMIKRSIQLQCPAWNGCTVIDCYFCLSTILNPDCHPFIVTSIILTITLVAIIVTCCLISLIRTICINVRFLRQCFNFCFRCRNTKKFHDDEEKLLTQGFRRKYRTSHSRTPRTYLRSVGRVLSLTVTVIMLSNIPVAEQCTETISITAQQNKCIRNSNYTICEIDQTTTVTLLPNGQSVCFLIKDEHENVIGSATLIMESIVSKCLAESRQFTRSYEVDVKISHRCRKAGSCNGDVCNMSNKLEELPEFSEFNKLPGNTFCMDGCIGLSCGCAVPYPSCLFYRPTATLIDDNIYEIFHCPSWEYEVKVHLTIDIASGKESTTFNLIPGATMQWSNVSMTATTITQPPTPVMSQMFISDGERVAIVNQLQSNLHCPGYEDARNFSCSMDKNTCTNCRVAQYSVACQCTEQHFETFFKQAEHRLPISSAHYTLRNTKDRVYVETHKTPIQLTFVLKSMKLSTLMDENKCNITPTILNGCYSCITGAEFNYECVTDFGQALAQVSCNDGTKFVQNCNSTKLTYTSVLMYNTAEVDTTCQVMCTGGNTEFEIKGELIYVPHNHQYRFSQRRSEIESESKCFFGICWDFDLNHWLITLLSWKQILWIIGVLIVIIVIIKLIKIMFGFRVTHYRWKKLFTWIYIYLMIIDQRVNMQTLETDTQRNNNSSSAHNTFAEVKTKLYFNSFDKMSRKVPLLYYLLEKYELSDPTQLATYWQDGIIRLKDAEELYKETVVTNYIKPTSFNFEVFVNGITATSATDVVMYTNGSWRKLTTFLAEKYGIQLKFPFLQCIWEDNWDFTRLFYPIELLDIHIAEENESNNESDDCIIPPFFFENTEERKSSIAEKGKKENNEIDNNNKMETLSNRFENMAIISKAEEKSDDEEKSTILIKNNKTNIEIRIESTNEKIVSHRGTEKKRQKYQKVILLKMAQESVINELIRLRYENSYLRKRQRSPSRESSTSSKTGQGKSKSPSKNDDNSQTEFKSTNASDSPILKSVVHVSPNQEKTSANSPVVRRLPFVNSPTKKSRSPMSSTKSTSPKRRRISRSKSPRGKGRCSACNSDQHYRNSKLCPKYGVNKSTKAEKSTKVIEKSPMPIKSTEPVDKAMEPSSSKTILTTPSSLLTYWKIPYLSQQSRDDSLQTLFKCASVLLAAQKPTDFEEARNLASTLLFKIKKTQDQVQYSQQKEK